MTTEGVRVSWTSTDGMAINLVVSVQHNGGFLPGIIMLTQCYHHRGTRLNAMKRFCIYLQPTMIPPKRFDIFPPDCGGCSEGLDASRFFFKIRVDLGCSRRRSDEPFFFRKSERI